ncbi:hypothetical protein Ccrd_018383 [Cynara cardunculus var. scolymus]|uniref:Cytochrome P450 n=1 Tax=Cynara cardunculus var. scolymus TaxID=59895 RepID=A0A103Y6C4_CYNCS|nr:hypothetical protein Ccrd_018383 [Cynara cardunculus var. scolymus]
MEDGYTRGILILACSIFTWIFLHRWSQRTNKGPKTWPLVGAAIEQLMNYDRMHDWLVNYLSKSSTVVVPMPFTTYTYIADPANVEHVLKTNFANYPKVSIISMYQAIQLTDFPFLMVTCIIRIWRCCLEMASLIQMVRTGGNKERRQALSLHLRTYETLAQWFSEITLRFIDPLWRVKKFLRVGSEAVLDQSIKMIDDFTYSVIRRRKAEIEEAQEVLNNDKMKHDILSRFIELEKDPENNINDKSLRDVVLNFVIAGRDTTATTLSWAIYMIMVHDHVAEKLYAELKAFEQDRAEEENVTLKHCETEDLESFDLRTKQFAQLMSYDSLGKLYYLHAVITETLRLYPAVPQDPKGILNDDILPDGTKVKAGGMVTYVPYSMGRMEYNWGPDANEFKPERWIKDGLFQNASPFKFTAFQAGPRICLGKDSAYLQMKMALAILCRFFKFELVEGHVVKYRMMTILSMANGLKITVSTRS